MKYLAWALVLILVGSGVFELAAILLSARDTFLNVGGLMVLLAFPFGAYYLMRAIFARRRTEHA